MKRADGGTTSRNQKVWLNQLNGAGIESVVCHGFEDAKKFVMERMEVKDESLERF